MGFRETLVWLLVALGVAVSAPGGTYKAVQCVEVRDCSTLITKLNGETLVVHLADIDCRSQNEEAIAALANVVLGKVILVEFTRGPTNNWAYGNVRVENRSINNMMVEAGWATRKSGQAQQSTVTQTPEAVLESKNPSQHSQLAESQNWDKETLPTQAPYAPARCLNPPPVPGPPPANADEEYLQDLREYITFLQTCKLQALLESSTYAQSPISTFDYGWPSSPSNPPSLSSGYKRTYDPTTGNTYSTFRFPDGTTRVQAYNLRTGSRWTQTIQPDGSMSGRDAGSNYWRYNARTGYYYNSGTGETRVTQGKNRTDSKGTRFNRTRPTTGGKSKK